jgi:DNA-binding LytR/AlgR family response regulator
MKKYTCILADDEPIARQIVKSYILQLPRLELLGEFKNGIEAADFIAKNSPINIAFLDINMPNLSGMEMAKKITSETHIIFTTAYSKYAVESYTVNTIDYLLKPFSFDRFKDAINKAIDKINKTDLLNINAEKEEDVMLLRSEGKIYPVKLSTIIYCEAMKNYTKLYLTDDNRLITLIALSKIELRLKKMSSEFIRSHRSFIVNKKYVKAISANFVMMLNHKVPIGYQYKPEFMKVIKHI